MPRKKKWRLPSFRSLPPGGINPPPRGKKKFSKASSVSNPLPTTIIHYQDLLWLSFGVILKAMTAAEAKFYRDGLGCPECLTPSWLSCKWPTCHGVPNRVPTDVLQCGISKSMSKSMSTSNGSIAMSRLYTSDGPLWRLAIREGADCCDELRSKHLDILGQQIGWCGARRSTVDRWILAPIVRVEIDRSWGTSWERNDTVLVTMS